MLQFRHITPDYSLECNDTLCDFKLPTDPNNADEMFQCGWRMLHGIGVHEDHEHYEVFIDQAAVLGHPLALAFNMVAYMDSRDVHQRGFDLLRRLSNEGNAIGLSVRCTS
jgi:hypothetical protein